MDLDKIWKTALGELEIVLSKANFSTWFKDTFISSYKNGVVVIGVPNAFTKEWLQNKYHREILEVLKKNFPHIDSLDYKVLSIHKLNNEDKAFKVSKPAFKPNPIIKNTQLNQEFKLKPEYTFEKFVVGNSNKLAHAASLQVAKNPGKKYNPLFIYGGVGLGKTHLMQAIGHDLLQSGKKVIYVSCEKFTNEFVYSIRNNATEKFKKKYRNTDALLVDDIQFLVGKGGTREEFFHTFNALHDKRRQIVISSDRPPKALSTLEDRLKSRFEWGMIVDIAPPDFETRKAILESKSQEKRFNLPDEVISQIAERVQSNIRELEGALNRLMAYVDLNNREPTIELVSQVLGSVISHKPSSLTFEKILDTVIKYYNVNLEDVLGRKRVKEIVIPRQIAMYLLRTELNYSFPQIATRIGKKDHTTIMYACGKIEKQLRTNLELQRDLNLIKEKLY